jgi:hypothetical protein
MVGVPRHANAIAVVIEILCEGGADCGAQAIVNVRIV